MSRKQEQTRNGAYNTQLLTLLLDVIGREVTVETRDGSKFEGIFTATHSDLDIGLSQVHRVENDKLLPHKNDICEKMIFACDDYVCLSAVLQDEKPKIKGFATDREYHSRRSNIEDGYAESTFEPWDADESVETEESKTDELADGGWSADDMFHVNKALGVESTYVENMSQYTNTPVIEKDSEDRIRAEKIAREIEQDHTSKAHALLENDDEERDLDKPTEYQISSRRSLPTNRVSYGSNSRGALSSTSGSSRSNVQGGRRSDIAVISGRGGKRERFPDTEGISKRERFSDSKVRGRGGSYNSVLPRSFTNSALTHGGKSAGNGLSGGCYNRYQGQAERPNAQMVHNEFTQFEMQQAGGGDGCAAANNTSKFTDRRSNQQQETTTGNSKLGHEASRVTRHNTNSPHNRTGGTDDARGNARGGSPHTGNRSHSNTLIRASSSSASNGSTSGLQKTKHGLVMGSRTFKSTVENSFPSSQVVHSSHEEIQNGATSNSPPTSSSTIQQPNAWNKGPPLSIRSPSTQSVHQGTNSKEPTPAESLSQNLSHEVVHSSPNQRETVLPAQTTPLSNASTTVSSSLAETSFVQSTTSTESSHRSSSDSSSPSVHAAVSTLSSSMQQMAITSSADGTPVLSANGSSSSIAPIDPQPTVNSSHANTSGSTYTPQTSGKKFEFNPDATPFTPRFVSTHTPTPRSTPAPIPTSAVHSHSIHPLSMNPAQSISVAQALPTGVITQPGPPFSFTPNASVYSSLPLYYGTQPVIPVGAQIAQVSASSAAAGVTGGPIVAGNTTVPTARAGQVATSAPGSRRTQLITGYIQNAVSYGPQVIPQYPVNVFAAPFQQLSVGSASVPPPTVPPPASGGGVAVGATPQPLQIIQTQQQHSQTAYTTRQYYQPSQSYLLATATSASRGYTPQHQSIDYSGNGQQPSSATSSNGNGSNGHNSQPATPGPQPIASPAQVAYSSGTNTPQPTHPVLMPIQSGTSHHPQHMYVQPSSAQFPFVPNGGYMVFNPQQVMQLSAIPSAAQVGLNQASQPLNVDHYQGLNEAHAGNQHNSAQTHGSVPSQQYLNTDQSYGQYIHGGN